MNEVFKLSLLCKSSKIRHIFKKEHCLAPITGKNKSTTLFNMSAAFFFINIITRIEYFNRRIMA